VVSAPDDAQLRRRLHVEVGRYCPPALRDRVDDIVQHAWMRLEAAGRKDARNRAPGTSLIKRVAFCAVMDENRRLTRRREVPIDAGMEQAATGATGPARAAQAAEIRRALRDCLARMLRNRRLGVTLYLQGHSAPDAGRLLGWTTAKAESLVFRGLADLRRCLEGKGVTP
jgi:RNA polymerase sigma-70 factor (ECF subfamily)